MAKTLRSILGESDAPRSKDEKQFYNMHRVEVIKNLSEPTKDDKLFNATNIKTTSRKPDRHGYEPGEDLSKYDAGRATVPGTMKPVMGKQFAPTTTYEDVKEPVQSNLTDKVFKDETNSHTQTKKKQKPHVNHYDGGSAKQVARMVAKHRANEDTIDEAGHSIKQLRQASDAHRLRKTASELTGGQYHEKGNYDAADKMVAKAQKHNKARMTADNLRTKLEITGKSHTSQLRKEDVLDEVSRDKLSSYVKKAIPNAGKMASGRTDYNRNRPNASETPFDRPLKNREQGVKTAFRKAAGIAKVNMKEDIVDEVSKETLGSYVKKSSNSLAGLRGIAHVIKSNKPNMDISGIVKKADNRRKGINKAVDKIVKEDVLDEEYESDYHYHQDHFMDHNHRAVEANKLAKHYDLSADLGMKEDPERSAMHTGLSDAYKKIATQHLKMAAYHARKSGIKSR